MVQGGIHSVRFFLLCMVFVFCGAVTYLYTDAGKAKVIRLALSYVNSQDYRVKIDKIESYFPLKVKLSQIKMRENDKTILSIKDAVIRADLYEWWMSQTLNIAAEIDELSLKQMPASSGEPASDLELGMDLHVDLVVNAFYLPNGQDGGLIKGDLPHFTVDYEVKKDALELHASAVLLFQGQDVDVKVKAWGRLNDFDLTYEVDGKQLAFESYGVSSIKSHGAFQHLPWRPEGDVHLQTKYAGDEASLKSHVAFQDALLRVEGLHAKAQGVDIKSDFSFDTQTLNAKGALDVDLNSAVKDKDLPLTGRLKLSSRFESIASDLNVHLKAVGKDLRFIDYMAGDINIEGDVKNLLKNSKGNFKGSIQDIETPVGTFSRLEASAEFHQNVSAVKLSLKGPSAFADVAFDLDYSKQQQILKLHSLQGMHSGVRVKLENPSQLTYRDSDFVLLPLKMTIMDSPIELSGKMTGGSVDLKAKGQLDALAFSRMILTDDDVATGKVDLDITVKGPLNQLNVSGGAEVKNGTYEKIIFGTSFKNINIKIKAEKDKLTIVEANATDSDKGRVTATGQYMIWESAFDVQVKGTQAQILRSDQMNLVAREGSIRLQGTPSKALISGKLTVDSAAFNIAPQVKSPRNSLNVINPVEREKISLPTNPHEALDSDDFDPDLDIEVLFPPVLKVAGRGLDSVWKGKLQLTGTVEDTDILGYLSLDRGSINFLGQSVVLKRGEIRFDGHEETIPLIDAAGVLEKPDLEVTISVIGRVNKPNIDLQSLPSLPKDEIISYLFFGKDKSSLSAIEGVQLARALITYRGGGEGFDLLGALTDNLGLDQINIGSGTTEGSYAVKVSKRLGDRLRINLNQGVKAEDSSVELEVDVTKNISVKAEHGFEGSSDGVSVNYNWDY